MGEREPRKEHTNKGELLYLLHPQTENVFSGYGLTVDEDRKDHLVGLLMVDRPYPADPKWLQDINDTYGECQLVPMTTGGERGKVCQINVELESQQYQRRGHQKNRQLLRKR